jgi:hypothetical protein
MNKTARTPVSNLEFEQWFLLFYTLFAIAAIAALMWAGRDAQEVERRKRVRRISGARGEFER